MSKRITYDEACDERSYGEDTTEKPKAHKKDLSDKPVRMTHQHYRLIARTINQLEALSCPEDVAKAFANALASTNPNFSAERFLAACNHSEG